MTVSQQVVLDHQDTNTYHNDVTVTDVPPGEFLAVIDKAPPRDGAPIRHIKIEILPLQQAPGGDRTIGTGLFVRKAGETSIQVTVLRGGAVVAENTTSYPS
ncbi:MAG: hypothetical protein AAFP77_03645 [Bacteroidota bacterium]